MDTAHQYDIFISYARTDGTGVSEQLEAELTTRGYIVWRDQQIRNSADFSAEIEKAIRRSKIVVVVMTQSIEANERSFVRREITYADYKQKPIIPLRVHVAMIASIANHTYVDYVDVEWDTAFENLVHAIDNEIELLDSGTYQPPETLPELLNDPYRIFAREQYELAVDLIEQTTIFNQEIQVAVNPSPAHINKSKPKNSLRQAYRRFGKKPSNIHDIHSLKDAMDEYDNRLLLLGEPGAGKTTALLALTRDLASQRHHNPSEPLPIFAFCSSWQASPPQPLHEWLAEANDLDAEELEEMIQKQQVILLLDGLDELGSSQVEEFSSVNEEGVDEIHRVPFDPRERFVTLLPSSGWMIISSRLQDYEAIQTKFDNLSGAVTLQKLDNDQIYEYLSDIPTLWQVLVNDTDLLELARTPLLLSLLAFGFQDAPESAHHLSSLTGTDLRDAIFTSFLERRYEHERLRLDAMDRVPPYTLSEIYEILGYVAMINTSGGTRIYAQQQDQTKIRDNVLNKVDFAGYYSNSLQDLIKRYSYLIESVVQSFVEYMIHLNLLTIVEGNIRFIHQRLRDTFVNIYCTPEQLADTSLYTDLYFPPNPAKALCRLPDKEGLDRCLKLLDADSPYIIRLCAARALPQVDDAKAVFALAEILKNDADISFRTSVAEVFYDNILWISRTIDLNVFAHVISDTLRNDTNFQIRYLLLLLLRRHIDKMNIGDSVSVIMDTLLFLIINENHEKINLNITKILLRIVNGYSVNLASEQSQTLYKVFTQDKSPYVRSKIIEILFDKFDPNMLSQLIIALDDSHEEVRVQIAIQLALALPEIDASTIIDKLIDAYKIEQTTVVKDAIANVLILIGTQRTLNTVFEQSNDS